MLLASYGATIGWIAMWSGYFVVVSPCYYIIVLKKTRSLSDTAHTTFMVTVAAFQAVIMQETSIYFMKEVRRNVCFHVVSANVLLFLLLCLAARAVNRLG